MKNKRLIMLASKFAFDFTAAITQKIKYDLENAINKNKDDRSVVFIRHLFITIPESKFFKQHEIIVVNRRSVYKPVLHIENISELITSISNFCYETLKSIVKKVKA